MCIRGLCGSGRTQSTGEGQSKKTLDTARYCKVAVYALIIIAIIGSCVGLGLAAGKIPVGIPIFGVSFSAAVVFVLLGLCFFEKRSRYQL